MSILLGFMKSESLTNGGSEIVIWFYFEASILVL